MVRKKCSGVPHAATPVTLTEANPSRYCGRSLIVAMPDLEAGRDPRRKHRKDNAVRRSFCSFQLTSAFQARSNKACREKAVYKCRKFSLRTFSFLLLCLGMHLNQNIDWAADHPTKFVQETNAMMAKVINSNSLSEHSDGNSLSLTTLKNWQL